MDFFKLSLFLYFPQDKSEYIPAVITTLIFLIGAVLTMLFIVKYSRKEAEKAKKLEAKLLKEQLKNEMD